VASGGAPGAPDPAGVARALGWVEAVMRDAFPPAAV
jgi:hypothetical protein